MSINGDLSNYDVFVEKFNLIQQKVFHLPIMQEESLKTDDLLEAVRQIERLCKNEKFYLNSTCFSDQLSSKNWEIKTTLFSPSDDLCLNIACVSQNRPAQTALGNVLLFFYQPLPKVWGSHQEQ